jgi:single-strand DNA-binding protein
MLPYLSMEGRLTKDPELRFAPSGVAVGSFTIVANSRKKNEAGEWVDDKVLFMPVVCFKQTAENVAESLRKGDLVVATGRINTDQWETDQGEKRSQVRLVADSVNVSLAMRTVTRDGIPERRRAEDGPPPDDPWTSDPPPATQSEEPPF